MGWGTYYVYADNNGCSAMDSVKVVVNPTPNITQMPDIIECDSVRLEVLSITGSNLSGSQAYYNQPGGVSPITTTLFTSQTVYVYDDNNGCTDEISFEVIVNPRDDASFTHVNHCEGDPNLATVTGLSLIHI